MKSIREAYEVDRVGYLSLVETVQGYKRKTYEMLKLGSGQSVLDIGCGIGQNVALIQQVVGPLGRAVGVDFDFDLLRSGVQKAVMRGTRTERFVNANAYGLPFQDGTFDRVRTDRMLQHIDYPEKALIEMRRVLAEGGICVASEPDWRTLLVSVQDNLTPKILDTIAANSVRNPSIGRELYPFFEKTGLKDLEVQPVVDTFTDFSLVDRIFNLSGTALNVVDPQTAQKWIHKAQTQPFFASFTMFIVKGIKKI